MRSWDQITAERDTLRVKQDALTAEISEAESAFNAYAEQIKMGTPVQEIPFRLSSSTWT
jgi:hypothetical protein